MSLRLRLDLKFYSYFLELRRLRLIILNTVSAPDGTDSFYIFMRRRDIRIFKIRSHTGVGILSEYQDLCHILPCEDVSSTSAVHAPPLQPPLLKNSLLHKIVTPE